MRTIISLVILLMAAHPVWAKQHAFVLANADYDELANLAHTHADAKAYEDAFEGFGYQVTRHRDLTRWETLIALDTFLSGIEPGDQVVFVYVGHGWSDGTVNYLVPTDAPRKVSTRVLKRQSFALRNGATGVLDELEALGVSLTVAIIDASRDNPFEPLAGSRSVGLSRGLVPVSAPEGSFVIFSAGEGQQALDRLPDDPPEQRLSVFTRIFVPHLVSGVALETAISAAQQETVQLASRYNDHQQHPAYYDQTPGDTCLKGQCRSVSEVAAKPPASRCDMLYQGAKSEKSCVAYEAYANSCNDHSSASVAQSFLANRCVTHEPTEVASETEKEEVREDIQTAVSRLKLVVQAAEIEQSLQLSRPARKEIQQRLKLVDHNPGSADGVFGKQTRSAISSWQGAQGVPVTGYLDREQLKTLNSQSKAAYEKRTKRRVVERKPAPIKPPAKAPVVPKIVTPKKVEKKTPEPERQFDNPLGRIDI